MLVIEARFIINKKVRSKTKFWQIIGRGTRLAKDLECSDHIDREYTGKKRFLIFDYCGNFEFFREKPNGFEGTEVKSLTESIFGRKIQLATVLQDNSFTEDSFKEWRKRLIKECHEQVEKLNPELFSVKLERQYVEKYKEPDAFTYISESDKGELIKHIAPLVYMVEPDEYAKRFDNFMYGLMIANLETSPSIKRARKYLCAICSALEKKGNIPQVNKKMAEIRAVNTEGYWNANDILLNENTRKELRELIKFLVEERPKPIITSLSDPITEQQEGAPLDPAYDFEDYRKKVNRYVEENGNSLAIHKLTHNIPLSQGDYQELQRVLTEELGSREDYQREYGDTPFGLLIRKIARLDHETAMEAFSVYINDESLNQKQITFLHKVINHVERNGYMEDITDLQKPPFDKPVSFIKLFDAKKRTQIMETIKGITDNATKIVG